MNVSIVIPVYNEVEHLSACLNAITNQTIQPLEVIVVDNNSTDGSVAVAKSFPFVTVLTESKQGVVHARNRGFNATKGDIIGRIDADTILPPGWVEQIHSTFDDGTVGAVSGSPDYYDFAWSNTANNIDKILRSYLSKALGNENFLWGANMAVRRSAWQKICHDLCSHSDMHEDFDLAIHLQNHGFKVVYDEKLLAGVSARRIDMPFWDFVRYTLVSPKTYAQHALISQRKMYPVLAACWLGYLPGRIIYRSYNHQTKTYSIRQLFNPIESRIDPTTNII